MKSRIAVCVLSLSVAVFSLALGGCSGETDTPKSSTVYSEITENTSSKPDSATEISSQKTGSSTPESSVQSEPQGEPTFLIGLDGKAVLTSEITRLENTDKTAETLTKDDLEAKVYCEGFAYYKEPLNIGYNSYKNPELFNEYKFLGDIPENKNEWKRVYVGDEICGLKVKSASVNFYVNDWDTYKFPERYVRANENRIEFEGTIEVEGFLEVNNDSVQYPESNGLMWFYPTSIDLPIVPTSLDLNKEKGFVRRFGVTGTYNQSESFLSFGEFKEVNLGRVDDVQCDMDGIGTGDIAYVRVTLKDIGVGAAIGAKLENVERLSEILAHTADDTTGGHGTMGRG